MALEIDPNKLQKRKDIEAEGINPYPYKFDQTHHAAEINKKYAALGAGEQTQIRVAVAGRIMLKRVMGKAAFFHIQDQSGRVQVYLQQNALGTETYHIASKKLDTGDIIGIEGLVFKTKMGEVTINAHRMILLCKSLSLMPEKYHGLKDEELRYRQRYIDLTVNPEVREVFVKRAKIYQSIRAFLDQQGFMEIQTPILQPEYGGANARPFVTKINAWNMKMYLRIAYELHLKRLMVGGLEKVYDLSNCFRNEDADRTHNPEFAMMEIQWAYADYHDAMKLTEELWAFVAEKVLGTTVFEYKGKKIDLKPPWKKLTMKQALKELANINVDALSDQQLYELVRNHNINYDGDIVRGTMIFRLFEELCENKLIQPTHIIDHPKESCPLAKQHRVDPALIERVEPFMNGWEVGNCYSELNDPLLQRTLLEEQAAKGRGGYEEAHPMDEDYLKALEFGLPPNCGIGIGVDRMVMLLTGQDSIRDVILFPTMKPQSIDSGETGKIGETGKAKETNVAVIILNKGAKMEAWQKMNTTAHLSASFAARKGKSLLLRETIAAKDKQEISLNIQHAIMIKEADSSKDLVKFMASIKEHGLEIIEFTREMLETMDDKKVIDMTKEKKYENIEFLGILVFGKKSLVENLTMKFRLMQ